MLSSNFKHLRKVTNNDEADVLNNFHPNNNLIHLQVLGQNQLPKEIQETKTIASKTIDLEAIHRNEMTNEIENQEVLQNLDSTNLNLK